MRTEIVSLIVATGLVASACRQSNPGDPNGEGGNNAGGGTGANTTLVLSDDAGVPGAVDSFFPLVDGATWLYRHTKADGEVRIENVRLVSCATEPERCNAWADYDPSMEGFWQGPLDTDAFSDRTEGVLGIVGSEVTRLHKWEYTKEGLLDFEVDYAPGFVRFDHLWVDQADDSVVSYEYVRTRVESSGSEVPGDTVENRTQTYTVLSQHETITVAAGEFDCIKVHREREEVATTVADETSGAKIFWFAPGIGKVREEQVSGSDAGKVEELVSCSLCE